MNQQKLNDYTLYEKTSVISKNDEDWFRENNICQEFNFLARQRRTTVEFILWNKKSKETSVSVSTTISNFRDIEGEDEIRRAHTALVRLGGRPPSLEDVLGRKTIRLSPAAPKGNS